MGISRTSDFRDSLSLPIPEASACLVFQTNCRYGRIIPDFDPISSSNLSLADNPALYGYFIALRKRSFISAQNRKVTGCIGTQTVKLLRDNG